MSNNISNTEISNEVKETEKKLNVAGAAKPQPDTAQVKKEAASAVKPEAVAHKLYIQYNDLEFSDELMFEAAVNAYCNESGGDKSCVKTVNLYVKPQEGKAYYVINDDAEKSGSIDL